MTNIINTKGKYVGEVLDKKGEAPVDFLFTVAFILVESVMLGTQNCRRSANPKSLIKVE